MALRYLPGIIVDLEVVVYLSTVPQLPRVVLPVLEDIQIALSRDAADTEQALPACWQILIRMLYSILVLHFIGSLYFCVCITSSLVLWSANRV